MSQVPLNIELELFERVTAAPDMELLRIAVRIAGEGDVVRARPTLLLLAGREQRRSPILAPPDADGVLRAAYAVSVSRLTPETKFALEFEDGTIVDLPQPTTGRARASSSDVAGSRRGATKEAPASLTKAELRGELAVAREQAAVAQAREIEFAALSLEAGNAAAALQAECERLAALNAELNLAPVDESAAISAAEAALRIAEDRAAAAIDEATAAQERAAELEGQLGELEGELREAGERVNEMELTLADAERANGELGGELERERQHTDQLKLAVDHARDELRVMTFERDELTRQVAAYDGVAVKARERAKQADESSASASAALRELQAWQADAERRLADATAELSALRSARDEAEVEVRELRGLLAEAEARSELAEGRSEQLASVEEDREERDS
jgi:hypothetical protein